ncbi:hypothetical protein VE02_09877, partial [Pseudogymnoascus sp. 03VT05]
MMKGVPRSLSRLSWNRSYFSNRTTFAVIPCRESRRCFHASEPRCVVKPYLLADIGEGITECQIMSWNVKPGDRVEQFDLICEVQSDKASVEITSRFDGTIKALHYEVDDMAVVGKPILDIDIEEEITDQEGLTTAQLNSEGQTEILNKQSGQLEEPELEIMDDIQQTAYTEEPGQPVESEGEPKSSTQSDPFADKRSTQASSVAIPAVRHMLKGMNLKISEITGTGKGGRVTKEDVQRHAASASPAKPTTTAVESVVKPTTDDRVVPFSGIEKEMFKVMTRSRNIPHFLYTQIVDCTSLSGLRKRVNADKAATSDTSTSGSTPKLTLLPIIMKVVSQVFNDFPKLNAHLDTSNGDSSAQLVLKGSHNFGVAVDTPRGLLVAVVRDVQNHSVFSLAAEIKRLGDLAREGRLAPNDLKGATFTISNIGSIGGSVVSPVIVDPQIGILGIGQSRGVPVFEKDGSGAERMVKREQVVLSWSADHRVLDGATVARCAEA